MNGMPTAAAADRIDVGGDLTVNRLGFGAMRITGPGIWGDPPDRDRAIQALRRADVAAASIELTAEEIRAINRAVLS
jgi:pyridoxine 4-dehydrogenase